MKIERVGTLACYRCRQANKKLVDLYWFYDWAPWPTPRVAAFCTKCVKPCSQDANTYTDPMELETALVTRALTNGNNS